MQDQEKNVEELESLEIVEAEGLKVGNAFHSFRFRVPESVEE